MAISPANPFPQSKPAGYMALVERYRVQALPNWHASYVSSRNSRRIESIRGRVEELFPASHWPGDSSAAQLEFAIKYDGVNLGILAALFAEIPKNEVLHLIQAKPTGKYARRIWFLYELLTGTHLPIEDLRQGNYVHLLEPGDYYTLAPGTRSRRQRIENNLLGGLDFCPTIRRTERLEKYEKSDLAAHCREVLAGYPRQLILRALGYLYTKETKASFQIENVEATRERTHRFAALLKQAEREDYCHKEGLIQLQNQIVDERFAADDYRVSQNYVGETVSLGNERIHHIGPKPEDLASLMNGLIDSHARLDRQEFSPVAHAAAIAYGFVFLHPFEDGNGRIHRFLIHNILARKGFTPEGMIFPVSAVMLKQPLDYDKSLEAFSLPLLALLDYSLDGEGRMKVHGDSARWYRFIDMTAQVEALFRFIQDTIDGDLLEELSFLKKYDMTKASIQEIIDMPDRLIDLFIRLCLQNQGTLSQNKRARHFGFLSDEELAAMERAVRRHHQD